MPLTSTGIAADALREPNKLPAFRLASITSYGKRPKARLMTLGASRI
ncbi:hypothetical protein DSL72_006324 [Monilinia vaccinii-corymbosi]|uniref:Uncharacterized protein n=1 Tax=Monilinia vaccinii-corymbosi TaxID=61207 RepID=A0A8A3PND5_9HELO|nr:hypothetical protein DSL72_006324 [Monilinia vaccinii-corymbosi]